LIYSIIGLILVILFLWIGRSIYKKAEYSNLEVNTNENDENMQGEKIEEENATELQ